MAEQISSIPTNQFVPNFVKADVEKAARNANTLGTEEDSTSQSAQNDQNQPEWIDLVHPNQTFDDFTSHFNYDDGGPTFQWSGDRQYENVQDHFNYWITEILITEIQQDDDCNLKLPQVDPTILNEDQQFAFNIVMKTLSDHADGSASNLKMVIAGEARSGKSYLIKCLVYAIRTFFRKNKAVQVLGPTGNSANLISGKTIHSFLKVPCGPRRWKKMTAPVGQTAQKLQSNCMGL